MTKNICSKEEAKVGQKVQSFPNLNQVVLADSTMTTGLGGGHLSKFIVFVLFVLEALTNSVILVSGHLLLDSVTQVWDCSQKF